MFVEHGDDLLAFGLPGRGKTHLVCAIGHELARVPRAVRRDLRASQRLLVAKRDLTLP